MNLTGKNVYLSGPISGMDDANVDEFAVAQYRLKMAGARYVYNPTGRLLSMREEKRVNMTHDQWMLDCIHELTNREKRDQLWHVLVPRKYDLLVQLDGWELSDGATDEYAVARACGIPCVSLREALRGADDDS